MAFLAAGLALCLAVGWIPLRNAIEPAYPTSYYAPAEPYAAASIARGAAVYAKNCVLCHGAAGHGDGPAVAGLPVRPADLTEPHLFAHSPGDLFWWVSHGRDDGVMPGFADVLSANQRWDVINFIRARAAGVLAARSGQRSPLPRRRRYPISHSRLTGCSTRWVKRLKPGRCCLCCLRARDRIPSGREASELQATSAAIRKSIAQFGSLYVGASTAGKRSRSPRPYLNQSEVAPAP